MFGLFAVWAKFEQELIVERTRVSLTTARERKGGHSRKMDKATLILAMAAIADPKSMCS